MNGPAIAQADTLIETAWNQFFNQKPWHFYRKSKPCRLKTFKMSKALDPLQDAPSKFPPMPMEQ